MNTIICLLALSFAPTLAFQDQTPFRSAPDDLMPSKVLASFPKKTFLENILALPNGDLLVDSYLNGSVYRVRPDGTFSIFAETTGKIAGIGQIPHGGFVVSGWSAKGEACVYEVSKDGKTVQPYAIPGGMFPNGVEHLKSDRFLIADSYAGLIWEYQTKTHQATVWMKDAVLERADLKDSTPAVNGIRIWGGYLYFSNTNAHRFYRVKLGASFDPLGTPELLAKDVNFDDFAIDAKENVYATTHILNSVQKLTPTGDLTTIAGLNDGMAGSTAATFGRTKATRNTLFVTTNGGLSVPPPGGVQPGKVVQVKIH